MRKTFSIVVLVGLLAAGAFFYRTYAASVSVSAIVGNVNAAPVVLSVTPSSSPIAVKVGTNKAISLQIQDNEGDVINYTITTPYGSVSPASGSMTDSATLIAGTAYLNFSYLAPMTAPGSIFNITVTLNDGPNLVTKNIAIYAY